MLTRRVPKPMHHNSGEFDWINAVLIDSLLRPFCFFFLLLLSKSWHLIQTSTTDTIQTRPRHSWSKSADMITSMNNTSYHACLMIMVEPFLRTREDREARFLASKMSIVASFRSWSGKLVKAYNLERDVQCCFRLYHDIPLPGVSSCSWMTGWMFTFFFFFYFPSVYI